MRGRTPVSLVAPGYVWEHRNVSDAGDLVVGITWMAVAVALWTQRRNRMNAVLFAAFAASWLLGSLTPTLVFLHRGPLAHLLLAYPTGRLGSWPTRAFVAAAYLDGIVAGLVGGPGWTLAFAVGLVAAASVRVFTATGVVRRSRAAPLAVAGAVCVVLAVGASSRLTGGEADVLLAYELVLILAGLVIGADLRASRWSGESVTGLVVDLGERHAGGVVRDRLARAIGDPSLTVAYVLDADRPPVDEHGEPVDLPPAGGGRVVTPVDLAGQPLALLIHDPAVVADRSLIGGAASALGVAVANAQLQSEVRARVADVEASTQRLLDAADAERRRLGSDLRAGVDLFLERAAEDLLAADADAGIVSRLEAVRDQLSRLAAGLDPVVLRERGLAPALDELARHAGLPVSVLLPADRFPPGIETCVWFTCAEAMANALKHAHASRLEISVNRRGDALHVEVIDDGVGGADPERGSGLRQLAERVRSAGGELEIRSAPGEGTRVVAELDLRAAA